MDLSGNLRYNQILELIHQLPVEEIEMLVKELQSEVSTKETSYEIDELISNAPTWSESDYDDYKNARNLFNNSRIK
jgi:tetrahydromethanopterin S-methyltransferase subunit A